MEKTFETIIITFNRQGDDAASGSFYEAVANLYAKQMEEQHPDAIVDVVGKSSGFEAIFDGEEDSDAYADFVTRQLETAVVMYINPVSGDVQSKEEWEAESIDWGTEEGEMSIEEQLATLIEVVKVDGEWIEA